MNETVHLDSAAPLTFTEEAAGEEMLTERPARLLEAGDYPDKGLSLTEDDLDGIAARFAAGQTTLTVPVKVEHVDSPLDPLGQVKRVWREGAALLGTLVFPDDLAGFLRRRGAAKLSVGLTREPLALCEVSLVLKPRIAGAAVVMGAEAPRPSPASGRGEPEPTPSRSSPPLPTGEGKEKDQEIIRLRAEIVARDVDAQIAAFKAQGRIVPASEAPARALLASAGEAMVTLAEGPEPIARVFRRFLESQPPVVTFGEAEGVSSEEAPEFTHYEHTFLSKRLGVDPAKVAALIRAEKTRKEENHAL